MRPSRCPSKVVLRILLAIAVPLLSTSQIPLAHGDPDETPVSVDDTKSIVIDDSPQHRVCFISGKAIYAEALNEEQWVGCSWSADGQNDFSCWDKVESAFEIEIKNEPADTTGTLLSKGWQWVSASGPVNTGRGNLQFTVELSNKLYPIGVKVHTELDGTPVMTRWLEITNTSDKALALTAVAPWSGRLWNQDAPITLGCSTFQTGQMTGSFGWRNLDSGVTTIQNTNQPSYDDPYFILRNEANREYFFGQLAWPTIYKMEFNKQNGLTYKIGPISVGGELRVIEAGGTIKTQSVHLCHLKGSFDAVVQAMHEHIRRSVMPARQPGFGYKVEYIANGDTGTCLYKGDEFNEDNLRPCVDVAAAIGAELFLIDGPFWAESGGQHGWIWSEGNKKLFPSGIKALSDYAHTRNILFGVYARTEGKGMLTRGGPGMFDTVCDMISTHGLDMYRHDTSEDQWRNWYYSTDRDGFNECALWRHHEVFYDDTKRIQEKYPHVIFQQADGGGGRSDLATARYWHENFQSDLTPVPLVYQMMAGFSVFLPPEIMQSAYHGMLGETMSDKGTLKRCIFALGNVPCIYWTLLPGNVSKLTPGELKEWNKYTELYKSFIRLLLPTCRVYHHAPINEVGNWDTGPWFAMQYMSPDMRKGWATVIRIGESDSPVYVLKLKGLNAGGNYRVSFDSRNETAIVSSQKLTGEGLSIPLESLYSSELLLFVQE